jgi:hypothetical protein
MGLSSRAVSGVGVLDVRVSSIVVFSVRMKGDGVPSVIESIWKF